MKGEKTGNQQCKKLYQQWDTTQRAYIICEHCNK